MVEGYHLDNRPDGKCNTEAVYMKRCVLQNIANLLPESCGKCNIHCCSLLGRISDTNKLSWKTGSVLGTTPERSKLVVERGTLH